MHTLHGNAQHTAQSKDDEECVHSEECNLYTREKEDSSVPKREGEDTSTHYPILSNGFQYQKETGVVHSFIRCEHRLLYVRIQHELQSRRDVHLNK